MAQKYFFQLNLLAIVNARTHLSIATICLYAVLIPYLILMLNSSGQLGMGFLAANVLLGLVGIWVVVASILLQVAMSVPVLTIVVVTIVALMLPWLVGPSLISQSSTILRLAGAKPGFVGVSRSERDKIRPGHCRGCGYSREGIGLLDPCPECMRVPQVI